MTNKNVFTKAVRKKTKLKLCLTGVSGSGKTYSALKMAAGIGGKIAFIDTEAGSASLYSNLVNFDVLELGAPYSPDRFVSSIEQAEKDGYDVLIIDSMSAAWAGSGGVLELVDDITKASRSKNSYMAWSEGNKEQEKLIQKILTSPLHIIACLRSKTAYEVMDNNGRKAPVKIGLQPIQRDSVEYEFQVVCDLSRENHFSTVSKDRTGLFGDKPFLITEKTGQELIGWLNEGVAEPKLNHDDLVTKIKSCSSFEDLTFLFNTMPDTDKNKDMVKLFAERKQEIINENAEDVPQ